MDADSQTPTHVSGVLMAPAPAYSAPGYLPPEIWFKIFEELLQMEAFPELRSLANVSRRLRENIVNYVPFVCTDPKHHAQICRAVKPPRLPNRPDVEVCKFMARPGDVPEEDFPFRLDLLYCSGCKCQHPTRAFSQTERRKASKRICIGREGHFRLCKHKTVTWAEVEQAVLARAAAASSPAPGYWYHGRDARAWRVHCFTCPNPDHSSPGAAMQLLYWGETWYLKVNWVAERCKQDLGNPIFKAGQGVSNSCKHTAMSIGCKYFRRRVVGLGNPARAALGWQGAKLWLNPSHEWFHAVDPRSYTHEDSRRLCPARNGADDSDSPNSDLPLHLCKDPSCEYYRYNYQDYCSYDGPSYRIPAQEAAWDGLHFSAEGEIYDVEEDDDENELSENSEGQESESRLEGESDSDTETQYEYGDSSEDEDGGGMEDLLVGGGHGAITACSNLRYHGQANNDQHRQRVVGLSGPRHWR